ncbi:phosphatidylinositol 3-kinase catalytic subunit type 3-like [Pollicipes pollicipes]|uniref:phosphatidylinositol 3-kinase catalytic subunit type 3-like n=1 Tax=Pollicipes pollicipes TaxID=41117 RepID=UPI001885969B|nr:phosphatidylinositol 3-kinase catalytic subunit type 3-like [Pollicipes pollicipes]
MGSQEYDDKFYYVYSCDLDANLQVKIGTLEGERRRPDFEDLLLDPMLEFSGRWQQQCSDMYVEVQVRGADGELALPVTTSYKAFTTRWNWNEWLTLPVRYCDLPEDASLRFTVFEPSRPQSAAVVGSTSIPIFTAEGCFNQGLHDLKLAPVESEGGGGEGAALADPAPSPAPAAGTVGSPKKDATDQMERLSKLTKRHRNGQLQQVDWLDRLTFREIELINEREKRSSSALYLMIEFPKILCDKQEYAMVYFEQGANMEVQYRTWTDLVTVDDHEAELDNLLELKHHHLARSLRSGFVQYVESSAVAEVLSTEGSILNFFRKHHPSEAGPYGVSADVMDTYIRSCAGYCVITYLLGVGDRHLDNLLLTKDGNLFHVDFGYILGRDPKPLPPPMKLSKEMVEAMGGVNSEHYQTFRKQCYTAFLHLRRHADVILHLFSLMVDANIPDIALEPDKTVRKVQDSSGERPPAAQTRLDLSDEEAVGYMQNMIDVSVTAVMAALVEQLHKFAQYWRR